jgi:hypothetical protein
MTLVIIGFLIGAALARRFRVFVLVPTIVLALLGTAAGIAHGDPMAVLTVVLIGTTLQLGYLAGAVAHACRDGPLLPMGLSPVAGWSPKHRKKLLQQNGDDRALKSSTWGSIG